MKYGKSFCCQNENGEDIYQFALRNDKETEVLISNYGAIITSFRIKTGEDKYNDIVLGMDTIPAYMDENYLYQYPYFGAAIGRYANRIKDAKMQIDGQTWTLSRNNITNQLHGGFRGFDRKVWEVVSFDDEKQNKLAFKYTSKDGEEGFPGNLQVTIRFELTETNELIYEYFATTDQPTAVNLTHHSYFNLNNGEGKIFDHEVMINADHYLEQDAEWVTTGNLVPVAGTSHDFKKPTAIEKNIDKAVGFDQSFVINRAADDELALAATVYSPKSNLQLEIFTTEPVVHLYTGQGIPVIAGKHRTTYSGYSGLCLETQVHPNAINIPTFPNTVLRPGETYHQKNIYRISVVPAK